MRTYYVVYVLCLVYTYNLAIIFLILQTLYTPLKTNNRRAARACAYLNML